GPPQELGRLRRELGRILLEESVPLLLRPLACLPGVPALAHRLWNLERRIRPADPLAGGGDLGGAERRAVRGAGAGFFGRTLGDDSLAADERRPVLFPLGLLDRLVYGLDVVPVDRRNHLPAVGGEALRHVVAEPVLQLALLGVD